ncbi:MAG: MerR family transcriptional regulator [Faecalicoccus sp.]|nr:MerR family transcriptional regulator [Faecalicoccus sp.]
MGLKIGQLSKLTDMSVETIRFYEKEKIISPKRLDNSKYRAYDVWDVFELNESLQYRNMGFSLKEVKEMMQSDSLMELDQKIMNKYRDIEKHIEHQHMLARFMASFHERISSAPDNIGNYWIHREDEKYYLPYCVRDGNSYTDADYTSQTLKKWLKTAPFYRAQLHVDISNIKQGLEAEMWSIFLEKDYYEFLGLEQTDEIKILPSQTYLHTIIDMGEKGELSIKQLRPALDYMETRGYQINGQILGEILVKCHEEGKWHRYMEIKIPVKK